MSRYGESRGSYGGGGREGRGGGGMSGGGDRGDRGSRYEWSGGGGSRNGDRSGHGYANEGGGTGGGGGGGGGYRAAGGGRTPDKERGGGGYGGGGYGNDDGGRAGYGGGGDGGGVEEPAPLAVKQCDDDCGDTCNNTRIYISGLPADATIEELRDLFGGIGQVARIKQKRGTYKDQWPWNVKIYTDDSGQPKGDAVLTYEDPSAAHSAGSFFNDHSIRGNKIKVTMAEKSAPRPTQAFGGRGGRGGGGGGGGFRGGGGRRPGGAPGPDRRDTGGYRARPY